ncbi:dephospho-CoA kinase [Xenophilus sp. Marseille-Q4582]|uniref:dephospho-CoA kinase n=1 Tax=Xenophilus sp. Marseille-Q4582 TaxID=2866600 RepID=UPI001CE410D8|nr:dephospho-CoA kinase [Xenophilus sp. Marseille-Q4582]
MPAAPRIGLTGGIGSGKSTVAALWVQRGATLVDTDAIARRITLPGGAAIAPLTRAFGPAVVDATGAMDRQAMREKVFRDPEAKRQLESILHPLIGEACEAQARQATGPVLFDIPLLVESGRWRPRLHRILVVEAEAQTQIQRVMARSGWPRETVEQVVAQQATRAARRGAADGIIHNEGKSLATLDGEVALLWARWVGAR